MALKAILGSKLLHVLLEGFLREALWILRFGGFGLCFWRGREWTFRPGFGRWWWFRALVLCRQWRGHGHDAADADGQRGDCPLETTGNGVWGVFELQSGAFMTPGELSLYPRCCGKTLRVLPDRSTEPSDICLPLCLAGGTVEVPRVTTGGVLSDVFMMRSASREPSFGSNEAWLRTDGDV